MIEVNSAIYIGIAAACVLERCPGSIVNVERISGGYALTGVRKVGSGSDMRSVGNVHSFLDAETRGTGPSDLQAAARIAGDMMGATLAGAR